MKMMKARWNNMTFLFIPLLSSWTQISGQIHIKQHFQVVDICQIYIWQYHVDATSLYSLFWDLVYDIYCCSLRWLYQRLVSMSSSYKACSSTWKFITTQELSVPFILYVFCWADEIILVPLSLHTSLSCFENTLYSVYKSLRKV